MWNEQRRRTPHDAGNIVRGGTSTKFGNANLNRSPLARQSYFAAFSLSGWTTHTPGILDPPFYANLRKKVSMGDEQALTCPRQFCRWPLRIEQRCPQGSERMSTLGRQRDGGTLAPYWRVSAPNQEPARVHREHPRPQGFESHFHHMCATILNHKIWVLQQYVNNT